MRGCLTGCLARLIVVPTICGIIAYVFAVLAFPWATHIGGQSTPFFYWTGSGTLRTKSGSYPLCIMIWPSSSQSRLRLDGMRPIGGVGGSGWICTSPGVMGSLEVSGTLYGNRGGTEGDLMGLRILERRKAFSIDYVHRGYIDLYGQWHGEQIAMNDRGHSPSTFRSGLKLEQASVTFGHGSYGDFKRTCANAGTSPADR